MFRKVLIANRGEIAVRVAATCQAMGIATAAIYSEADAGALHVRIADEAYPIGSAPLSRGYLNLEAVMEAAERAGADALHPGYGFLSENPGLAGACREAGVTFIGPTPEAMRLLGSKIAARRLAQAAGVPIVPGYHGDDQADEALLARAREIGAPLLIKAATGGGGRGMRVVRDLAAFHEALAAARREARSAFGDDAVLLERLVENPRHIEFQIIGDRHGTVLHLGERECSVQRRHQKIVEEAPSPAVSSSLRAEMGAAAVTVARAAGYTNAGTVEFLLAPDGAYYFLEMNARLQVEHPVTELVYGIDLVALQLRVAAGEPLPFGQEEVTARGHAVECRLYAEDCTAGFLPSTGRLLAFEVPGGPGLRLDTGVQADDEVTIHYDPMLAKLIAHGESRSEAVSRALWALRRTAILGVQSNLMLLDRILSHPAFAAGHLTTGFIERHIGDASEPGAPTPDALLLASLWQVTAQPEAVDRETGDPWRASSSWSLSPTRTVRLTHQDASYTIEVTRAETPRWTARVGDTFYAVATLERHGPTGLTVRLNGRVLHGHVARRDADILVAHGGGAWTLSPAWPPDVDAAARHRPGAIGTTGQASLLAPMPGTVVRVYVTAGQTVEPRQRVIALEAMKMEHTVEAPFRGVVRAILHHEGDTVPAGARLVELEEG